MYSTVRDMSGAIEAAARLAELREAVGVANGPDRLIAALPLLVDQVAAEAGVFAPHVCARALGQAAGDVVRAVSLVRAWAATLPRVAHTRAGLDDMRIFRRITPAFRAPARGQYLGASLDYAQRLLDFGDGLPVGIPLKPSRNGHGAAEDPLGPESLPRTWDDDRRPEDAPSNGLGAAGGFPRAALTLEREGLLGLVDPPARPFDRTRNQAQPHGDRGAFLQLLSRSETGSLTALAYSAQRGFGQRQDPTLIELRQGSLPLRMRRPDTAREFVLGWIPVTTAEVAMYRMHDGQPDARLTLGFGATLGRVERRAIAAAVLDATCARAVQQPPSVKEPSEDEELLTAILDGQEASGFVEHLKLPHHVTFTSDLDRLRQVRGSNGE